MGRRGGSHPLLDSGKGPLYLLTDVDVLLLASNPGLALAASRCLWDAGMTFQLVATGRYPSVRSMSNCVGSAVIDAGSLRTDDPDLVASLQAQGVDVDGVDQQLLGQLRDAFGLRVVVELPDGQRTVVEPKVGAPATVDSAASVLDTRRILFAVGALVLVAGAVVVLLWPRRRVRRRRREATRDTYRRAAAEHQPLSWDEATRERMPRPRTPPGSAAPPRRRRH